MPNKEAIAPGVWLAAAFTFAAFALGKSAFGEWFDPVGVGVIFWLLIALAVVCAFMALRTYFIAQGRLEASNEQNAFVGTAGFPHQPLAVVHAAKPKGDIDLKVTICELAFGPSDHAGETLVLFLLVFDSQLAIALQLGDFTLDVVLNDGSRPETERNHPVASYAVPDGWATHEHWDTGHVDRPLTIKDDLLFTTYPMRLLSEPMPLFGLIAGLLCFRVDAPLEAVTPIGTKFYLNCKDESKVARSFARYTIRKQGFPSTGLLGRSATE